MQNRLPVETISLRRTYRVGACPVLEAAVTYPHIPEDASPAVIRFNDAYRTAAENFLAWAEEIPAEAAKTAFAALGSAAPYRFDRRLLSCTMMPAPAAAEESGETELRILRTVTSSSRRGGISPVTLTAADRWRLPELTLRPPLRHRGTRVKQHKNLGKTL